MAKINWKSLHKLLPKFENDISRQLGIASQKITATWEGVDSDGDGKIVIYISK